MGALLSWQHAQQGKPRTGADHGDERGGRSVARLRHRRGASSLPHSKALAAATRSEERLHLTSNDDRQPRAPASCRHALAARMRGSARAPAMESTGLLSHGCPKARWDGVAALLRRRACRSRLRQPCDLEAERLARHHRDHDDASANSHHASEQTRDATCPAPHALPVSLPSTDPA